MSSNLIGYHIVNQIGDGAFNDVLAHMARIKSAVVNYQINEKPDQFSPEKRDWQRVDRIRATLPDALIVVRLWPDDGNWSKRPPAEQYRVFIAPFRDWFVAQNLVVLADNESVQANMAPYANWHVDLMDRAGEAGVRLAVGRTAVGNPDHHHYAQMDPLWIALAASKGRHMYSPNEYFDVDRDNDLVGRYRRAWARFDALGLPRPLTTIGEFGFAGGLKAHNGFRKFEIDERQYARRVIGYARSQYQHVPVAIFCAGPWHGFDVGPAFYETIEQEATDLNYTPLPQTAPAIPGPADSRWKSVRLIGRPTLIRAEPSTDSAELGRIPAGDGMLLPTIPTDALTPAELAHVQRGAYTWRHVRLADGRIAYVRADVVREADPAPVPIPPPPPPAPEPQPEPPPTPAPTPEPGAFVSHAYLEAALQAMLHKIEDEFIRRADALTLDDLRQIIATLNAILEARQPTE